MYELPPIVKLSERLLKEIEQAVRQWPRYHKYQHGAVLRGQIMKVAQLAHRAWRDKQNQIALIDKLVWSIDDLKLSLQLGSQIKAFISFAQFEVLARLAAELGQQVGGWQKHLKGQNAARPSAGPQRPQILGLKLCITA